MGESKVHLLKYGVFTGTLLHFQSGAVSIQYQYFPCAITHIQLVSLPILHILFLFFLMGFFLVKLLVILLMVLSVSSVSSLHFAAVTLKISPLIISATFYFTTIY